MSRVFHRSQDILPDYVRLYLEIFIDDLNFSEANRFEKARLIENKEWFEFYTIFLISQKT